MIKLNKFFICLTYFLYIFCGNTLTFLILGFPLKVCEIVSVITIIFTLFSINSFKLKIDKKNPINYLILWVLFAMIVCFISFVCYGFPAIELISGLFYSIRLFLIFFFAKVSVMFYKKYRFSFDEVLKLFLYIYFLVCLVGFFQYIFYPIAFDFYDIFYSYNVYFPNPDPHQYRLISTYFDPNYLCNILAIPIAILIYLYSGNKLNKSWLLFLVSIFLISSVLTQSRSGFLNIGVLFCFYFLCNIDYRKISLNKAIKKIILFSFVSIVLFVLIFYSDISIFVRLRSGFEDASSQARFASWLSGLEVFSSNFIIGIGFNMLSAYEEYILLNEILLSNGAGNDSSLILVLITSGTLGMSIFVVFLYKFFKCKNISLVFKGLLFSSLIAASFINLFFYTLWLFVFINIIELNYAKNKDEFTVLKEY